jgi:hypothetical protein
MGRMYSLLPPHFWLDDNSRRQFWMAAIAVLLAQSVQSLFTQGIATLAGTRVAAARMPPSHA